MAIESQNRRARNKTAAKRKKKTTRKSTRKQSSSFQFSVAEHVSREAFGIIYGTLAVVFFLSLIGSAGMVGGKIQGLLSSLFGIGQWLAPLTLMGLAIALFVSRKVEFHFTRNVGIVLLLASLLGIVHLGTELNAMDQDVSSYGGWIGFTSSVLFRIFFGDFTAGVILFGMFMISILITFEISFKDIWDYFHPETELKTIKSDKTVVAVNPDLEGKDVEDGEIRIIKPAKVEEVEDVEPKQLKAAEAGDESKTEAAKEKIKKAMAVKRPVKKDAIEITNIQYSGDWKFPSLDLLIDEIDSNYPSDDALQKQAENIREKLNQFGIEVDMVDARVGPTVTQFTMAPKEGVPVKKIANSKDDLALALAAKSIRIEAPIPGQPYVGIETPNEDRSTVYMREILESEEFAKIDSPLRLAMGKDVAGNPFVADLAKMPHLLIAGATGAGKSVGMNTFLVSLLYQNSPSDLKFIMIDPKRVELTGYNGIPHLLTPVITEADKALASLKWAVAEMMRRYEECSQKGYRNIQEYNEAEDQKMSKIVIVIDELADLMMRDFKKDTEAAIMRLAQMARAVGMHLIIATQRPSVDVITGVIKANIPTRISFTVMSSIDSRTVLDSIGAEELLGMGDMLFTNPQLPKPMRVQGIYISSKEIEKVVNHVKLTPEPEDKVEINLGADPEAKANDMGIGVDLEAIAAAANEDELVPEAIEVVRRTGKASATLFQRMLSVGYARAAKILDILEQKGIVGPANGAKPREIFIERLEDE